MPASLECRITLDLTSAFDYLFTQFSQKLVDIKKRDYSNNM